MSEDLQNAPLRFGDAFDHLHEEAMRASGLETFGPDDYEPGLRQLLASVDRDAGLTAPGRQRLWQDILGTLISRQHAAQGLKSNDGALDRPVVKPIAITGIPRTGTTALHKLMSVDPQFQGLESWIAKFPMPRPPRASWETNPLYQKVRLDWAAFFEASPDIKRVHFSAADEVDECLLVLQQSFITNRFGSRVHLPSYDAWVRLQSERASYGWYADILRLIGRYDNRRWLLKNPGHFGRLEDLIATFPDVTIIATHRDPVRAIPSLCSLLEMTRQFSESSCSSARDIACREMRQWSEAARQYLEIRKTEPSSRFIDVDHSVFNRDPLGTVEAIYDRLGLSLRSGVADDMRKRIGKDPERSHGIHRYDAKHFGLYEDVIESIFADYRREFRFNL